MFCFVAVFALLFLVLFGQQPIVFYAVFLTIILRDALRASLAITRAAIYPTGASKIIVL